MMVCGVGGCGTRAAATGSQGRWDLPPLCERHYAQHRRGTLQWPPVSEARTAPGPWMASAACAGKPTSWWYSDHRHVEGSKALAMCVRCPVAAECLSHALDTREPEGLWGGRTPEERRRLLGVRRRDWHVA